MKRLLVGVISSIILSAFSGCGKPPVACEADSLMSAPQVCPDRESLGFAQEFNSGTFIGQKPQETLVIRNGGVKDLEITSARLTGDGAFKLTTNPAELPATIKGNKNFYMQVIFAPTQAKRYEAKITVESNAENSPTREFLVSGCGVPTDGGTSPCYGADAGTP